MRSAIGFILIYSSHAPPVSTADKTGENLPLFAIRLDLAPYSDIRKGLIEKLCSSKQNVDTLEPVLTLSNYLCILSSRRGRELDP